ncbi:hypothetical protein DSC91_003192 [Paraburkholderia caffeinilytica]|uniref:hypothetical protein n=1 Tax=Paraburkholderia caffeinilytica TaxID=1761016 RepID=UPI000E20CEFD|nr:hypothetical protein [Paraburkholderia caffeinilytica]AXL50811.1 hypothetical protein DSC91_003192 [Paraburkholderia caffeinilytica]CAB3803851.1 hypothetical protein LMG28690_05890 [Paraburkholderia caffeinilytica]
MNKSKKCALLASAVTALGLYKLFVFFQDVQTGCIQFQTHQTCSYENAENFQGLLDLELMFACGWAAGAVICWMVAAQAKKSER